MVLGIFAVILILSCMIAGWIIFRHHRAQIIMGSERVQLDAPDTGDIPREVTEMERPPLNVQLLTVNEYSRPGIPLEEVNGIVIHYTANPCTSAQDNRD